MRLTKNQAKKRFPKMKRYNPHNLPVEKSKVLIEFDKNKETYLNVDTVAIVSQHHRDCVVSMDRIRQDNGERIYFAGTTKDLRFLYVDKKYTKEIK